ncbi:MAG: hypothetical protein ACI9N0_000643 [Ilumatobacter sp.]
MKGTFVGAEFQAKTTDQAQPVQREAAVHQNAADATGPAIVQRSLKVGASDDRFEVEADAVAVDVVRHLQRDRSGAQTMIEDAGSGRVRRSATTERATKPLRSASRIQRMSRSAQLSVDPIVGSEGGSVDGQVASEIRSRAGGRVLDVDVRRKMEGAFGADFSGVRVHTDSTVAGSIGAKAFTHGSDVHFAPGTYQPQSTEGQHLLAHELTHTLQQGAARGTMRTLADVQRDHTDTGLKKEGAIATFSKKVKARSTGGKNPLGSVKDWDTLSVGARVAKLTKYVNAELVKTHVPPVTYTLDPGKDAGDAEFDFTTWSLTVGSNGLGADMSDDLIGSVADNVYHESRHAEQWFRVARVKAGESPAPTSDSLAATLYIPANIAKAAHGRPLKPLTKLQKFFHSKKHNERQAVKIDEAQSWYESVYGAGGSDRNEVLGDIQVRYDEYRALSEEVDAWDVGGKAGAKVRQLIADLRVKQAAAAAAKATKVGSA